MLKSQYTFCCLKLSIVTTLKIKIRDSMQFLKNFAHGRSRKRIIQYFLPLNHTLIWFRGFRTQFGTKFTFWMNWKFTVLKYTQFKSHKSQWNHKNRSTSLTLKFLRLLKYLYLLTPSQKLFHFIKIPIFKKMFYKRTRKIYCHQRKKIFKALRQTETHKMKRKFLNRKFYGFMILWWLFLEIRKQL